MWWKHAHATFQPSHINISRRIIQFLTHFGTDPFLTSHPPFLMTILSKCRSLYLLLFLLLLLVVSAGAEVGLPLQLFWESHKKEWKIEESKKSPFSTFQNRWIGGLQIFLLDMRIYTIWYSEFPLLSEDYSDRLSGKWHIFIKVNAGETWVAGSWQWVSGQREYVIF